MPRRDTRCASAHSSNAAHRRTKNLTRRLTLGTRLLHQCSRFGVGQAWCAIDTNHLLRGRRHRLGVAQHNVQPTQASKQVRRCACRNARQAWRAWCAPWAQVTEPRSWARRCSEPSLRTRHDGASAQPPRAKQAPFRASRRRDQAWEAAHTRLRVSLQNRCPPLRRRLPTASSVTRRPAGRSGKLLSCLPKRLATRRARCGAHAAGGAHSAVSAVTPAIAPTHAAAAERSPRGAGAGGGGRTSVPLCRSFWRELRGAQLLRLVRSASGAARGAQHGVALQGAATRDARCGGATHGQACLPHGGLGRLQHT